MSVERETLEFIRSADQAGRMLAIAELLRIGWPVSKVIAAVRLADQGHIEPALDTLRGRFGA